MKSTYHFLFLVLVFSWTKKGSKGDSSFSVCADLNGLMYYENIVPKFCCIEVFADTKNVLNGAASSGAHPGISDKSR